MAKYGAAFASCGDRIRKHDPAFAGDIEVEIGINVDGSINFVTTVKGLDDGNDEACVLNVIRDRFTFPAGSAGTVRKKIRF